MSAMDDYEHIDDRRHRSHKHRDRRDDREPRYVETKETYVRSPVAAEPVYAQRTEMIRRPVREDSDLSIEEVRRDFPPPSSAAYVQQRSMVSRDDRYGAVRSRSAERGSQYGDPRRSYNEIDDRRSRAKSRIDVEQEIKPRRRSLSRNQKIIAGVAGAALAVGGKELWDRKQADGRPVSRNALQTAAVGAAGAFAAYEGAEYYTKHNAKEEKVKTYAAVRDKNGEVAEYYESEEEPTKPKRTKSRRKSIVEGALGLAGLGAAAKASGGGKHHSRRGSGDSYDSRDSRHRSRGGGEEGAAKFQQAAKAALLAGATEAFRVRNEPGGWGGDKGKRILTAAIGAGGIDAAADRNPDKKSKRHILEAVVGGLAGNRLINGSRKEIDEGDDGRSIRSRSRSRSRGPSGGGGGSGPLAALATAGLGALAAKKLTDRSRSRSRGASRGPSRRGSSRRRRYSSDSYDSRSPSPRRGEKRDKHKRSKSVSDYARNGLAALGIGGAAGAAAGDHRDRDVVEEETTVRRKSRRGGSDRRRDDSEDSYDDRRASGRSRRGGGYEEPRGDPYGDSRYADSRASNVGSRSGGGGRSARQKDGQKNKKIAEGKDGGYDSDSSLGSSSGDEKRIKKMKAPRY